MTGFLSENLPYPVAGGGDDDAPVYNANISFGGIGFSEFGVWL